jgi:hypothetical protein
VSKTILDYLESKECMIPGFDIPDKIYKQFEELVRGSGK